MLRNSIIFKGWPKDYKHIRKANMKTYIRKMRLINLQIEKAVDRIKKIMPEES
jgi:hypothetical protein